MASVKFGGGIVAMSGSIAGNVFSHNSFGAYVRARTTPINPRTANQNAVRASIAFLAAFWSETLTAAQRTAWNQYAAAVAMTNRLGESVFLSGYNHFLRSNSVTKRSGFAVHQAGPTILELPAQDPTMTLTASAAAQTLTVSFDDTMSVYDENSGRAYVFQGQPQNAQRNFFDGPWRLVGVLQGSASSGLSSPQVLAVDFQIAEDQRQYIYARIQRGDGRLSEKFRADAFVAA